MRAGTLVRTKGTTTHWIGPHATLPAAAVEMHHHRIGSLLVLDRMVGSAGELAFGAGSDRDQVLGLVTERDIVTAFAVHGPAAAWLPVIRFTHPVVRCDETDTLEHVMSIMTDHRTRHVPVYTGSLLLGILSIGDVVKQRLVDLEDENRITQDYIRWGRS